MFKLSAAFAEAAFAGLVLLHCQPGLTATVSLYPVAPGDYILDRFDLPGKQVHRVDPRRLKSGQWCAVTTAPLTWAQRLKRTFEIDSSLCPLCGGKLRVIADITEPELITRILNHIQNRDPPRRAPRRALPHSDPNDLFAQR